jgi:hypothetical protein
VDWNELLIKKLADSFKVGCQWRRASRILQEVNTDEAEGMAPSPWEPRKGEILPYLLRLLGATTYLTGPSWRSYAPNLREVLKSHGIELEEVKS